MRTNRPFHYYRYGCNNIYSHYIILLCIHGPIKKWTDWSIDIWINCGKHVIHRIPRVCNVCICSLARAEDKQTQPYNRTKEYNIIIIYYTYTSKRSYILIWRPNKLFNNINLFVSRSIMYMHYTYYNNSLKKRVGEKTFIRVCWIQLNYLAYYL